MFLSDVSFEDAGRLQTESRDLEGLVMSTAPHVMRCSVCKGLVLNEDTEAHAKWHVVNSIGFG